MADEKEDLNLAKGQADAAEAKGGMNKMVLIIGALVLLLAGAGGAYFFAGGSSDTPAAEGEQAVAEKAPEPEAPPIYYPLSPAFLVNYEQDGQIHYLQIEMQVMARDQAVIDQVEANMPAVRNALILLFGDQDYQHLATTQGKEELRQQVLEAVDKVIRASEGNGLDDVFFTGFVMQ